MKNIETQQNIVTRFAPSPTGDLHIGGLRTALYAWLYARQHGGKFLLRIDDTDRNRYQPGSDQGIFDALDWVGLNYDETFRQSERREIHQQHAEQLISNGHAYRCFCTPERLDEMRKDQQAKKEPPRYDRTCRDLDESEIKQKLEHSTAYTIRFKIPDSGETTVHDIVRGMVTFQNSELDDFVLLKSDGYPTYHLATIVDDHEFGITHVTRSEEWFPSLPKHVLLYQAFGWELPQFVHYSMILAPDKSKLSKRHGATGVLEFKKLGFLPEALINFVLLLGWHPKEGSEQEFFTKEDMFKQFDLKDVQKSAAIFDHQKLDWMNAHYIREMSLDQLTELAKPYFASVEDITLLQQAISLEQERIKKLSDLPEVLTFVFKEIEYDPELLIWKKSDKEKTARTLTQLTGLLETLDESNWNKESLEPLIMDLIEKEGLGTGDTLWPMRVSLTGQKNSPGPFEVATVLGKHKTLTRLNTALEKLAT